MQANQLRYIKSGNEFDGYFPVATNKDSVVTASAGLDQTISLMQSIVPETKKDTELIAKKLKKGSIRNTCKAIWDFVYHHIQYRRDKMGIEQVRRPSRSWADRTQGVDCDCYSVFISSILMNLGIQHKIRITKYNGRPNFQHVYPIVPTTNGHIAIDCVTDRFDYEVPFSDYRDYDVKDTNGPDNDLSGVDSIALGPSSLDALLQPRLPLHKVQSPQSCTMNIQIRSSNPVLVSSSNIPGKSDRFDRITGRKRRKRKQGKFQSPYRNTTDSKMFTGKRHQKGIAEAGNSVSLFKTLLTLGIGYGAYKLFSTTKTTRNTKKKKKSN